MEIKKINLLIIISLVISLFYVTTALAVSEGEYIDPEIPESWYEEPSLASEEGIESFNQSPMLNERVEKGEIPNVEKRLPEDPVVVQPYKEVGKYGGTAITWGTELAFNWNSEGWALNPGGRLLRPTPDGKKQTPFLIKDWEYSNNYKTLTIYLRKGLKWSDGHPLTAQDFIFWWKYEAQNEQLTPVSPENWEPVALLDVTSSDKYTVSYHMNKPNPTQHHGWHVWSDWGPVPAHFAKNFHPEFIGKEKAQKLAEEAELDLWDEYYSRMVYDSLNHPEYEHQAPVLRPYVSVERSETTLLAERNPYFPLVDIEGNQLPYIDKLRVNLAQEKEMMNMKMTTGEATFAGVHTKATDIPLYEKNKEKGDYQVNVWNSGRGSALSIMPNLTHKNEKIRNIFRDLRFRKALSLAIDRNDINRKVFYGRAVPRQATTLPISEYFKPEFAESYAEFDPERAKKLLDEMGMEDVTGDGYRERPDGEPFRPTLTYNDHEGPRTQILELVRSDLEKVGINLELKMVSWDLKIQRWQSNNFDMGEWHIDRVMDLVTPIMLTKTLAPTWPSYEDWTSPWPAWINWYNSDGEQGMEPPEKIKEVIDYAEQFRYATDPQTRKEAGIKLMEAQAENLWTIGTVGMIPWPVLTSNKLKNVPSKGFWTDDLQRFVPFYPSQFYLEE